MSETLIVDASVAVKWVVSESGSDQAVKLRTAFDFLAPDLIVAECANILWKKAMRRELTREEAVLAARLLARSGVELVGLRGLGEAATALAIDLGHPAYDCAYLALARERNCRFVTADRRLLTLVRQRAPSDLAALCVDLDAVPGPLP